MKCVHIVGKTTITTVLCFKQSLLSLSLSLFHLVEAFLQSIKKHPAHFLPSAYSPCLSSFPQRDFLFPDLTSSSPDSGPALLHSGSLSGVTRAASATSALSARRPRRRGPEPLCGACSEGRGRGESRSWRPCEGRRSVRGGGEVVKESGGGMGTAECAKGPTHTHVGGHARMPLLGWALRSK